MRPFPRFWSVRTFNFVIFKTTAFDISETEEDAPMAYNIINFYFYILFFMCLVEEEKRKEDLSFHNEKNLNLSSTTLYEFLVYFYAKLLSSSSSLKTRCLATSCNPLGNTSLFTSLSKFRSFALHIPTLRFGPVA